jgi:hypothetical protein
VAPAQIIPEEDGGVLIEPPSGEWAALARDNSSRMQSVGSAPLAGEDLASLRARARGEALESARAYSASVGVESVVEEDAEQELLLMTGHQPTLFHPGVWAKHLVLDLVARGADAAAIDLVVDSDGFDAVTLHAPCLEPDVGRCEVALARAAPQGFFAGTPAPTTEEVEAFYSEGDAVLRTLGVTDPGTHFRAYCGGLREACACHGDLGAALTCARRRFEAPLGTDYLELSVIAQSQGGAFLAFASELALRAEEVATVQNEELASYRERYGVRSAARPFPDLREQDGAWELPLWHLHDGERGAVWARSVGSEVELTSGDAVVARIPRDPAGAAERLANEAPALAPKALTLTLFNRLLVADLFVHGVGGAKYERVTDRVAERLFGVALPPFAVVTMTLHLPLGERRVREIDVEAARRRLQELAHNPDRHIEEIASGDPERADEARELARAKARLVEQITFEGADKKTLGAQIRDVNERMTALAAPLVHEAEQELSRLEQARQADGVFRDRTYPFCLWDPFDVRNRLV